MMLELFDVLNGPRDDLTNKVTKQKLLQDLRRGQILGVMLAPPCNTFSVAFDRGTPIRSAQYPWGLPDVDSRLSERLASGNRLGMK